MAQRFRDFEVVHGSGGVGFTLSAKSIHSLCILSAAIGVILASLATVGDPCSLNFILSRAECDETRAGND